MAIKLLLTLGLVFLVGQTAATEVYPDKIASPAEVPREVDESIADEIYKTENLLKTLQELIGEEEKGITEEDERELSTDGLAEKLLQEARSVGAGTRWQHIDGGLKFVSVGPSGVWGVNSGDRIYYRTGTYKNEASPGTGWVRIDGALKQISSGNDIVWGVNSNDDIYLRLGIGSRSHRGSAWRQIAGKLKQVHVSPTSNQVWGVNSADNIYRRTGITASNPAGTDWQRIDGGLKFVSVGRAGVWGVNTHDQIFYRTGTAGNEASPGSGWVQVSGGLKQISSGNGEVWGVNSNNQIYIRRGLNAGAPQGSSWQLIQGALKEVYISSSSNQVWGVNAADNIFRRVGQSIG